jgi:hypothetical protein
MLREYTAVALSSFMAIGPSMSAWAAPSNGTVSGQVTIDGRPLQGMGLALIDLKSGEIHRTKSNAQGGYRVQVLPGEYALTTVSLAGLSVGKAPSRVVVERGRVVVASLELMKLAIPFQAAEQAAQTPPASGPQTAGNITFEPVGCMVAGQFPLIEATIQPAASVARARVYFKSALSPAFYYVEMVQSAGTAGLLRGPALASANAESAVAAAAQAPGRYGQVRRQAAEAEARGVADHLVHHVDHDGRPGEPDGRGPVTGRRGRERVP